jgi:YVTN family beta-propeller protein
MKAMTKYFFWVLLIVAPMMVRSQNNPSAGMHSHNDYEQKEPFFAAYREGYSSIEADIYLIDGVILVGHDQKDLKRERNLEDLYLKPLAQAIKENKGRPYPNKQKSLQILIDIKSAAEPTLNALMSLLEKYPSIRKNRKIIIAISGNRPKEDKYATYPKFIYFDGRPGVNYSPEALARVALISDSYGNYLLPGSQNIDVQKAGTAVANAHALKKPFRFWGTPDHAESWKKFIDLGVDFVNTDQVAGLASYMRDPQNYLREKNLGKIQMHDSISMMPFNRLIRSAGNVIRFGNPAYENHALDIVAIPATELVVVEDRYGIFVMNLQGKRIDSFLLPSAGTFRGMSSTYSGIKCFISQGKTWIAWSVARDTMAALVYAEWNGRIGKVSAISMPRKLPAKNAIPNEIYVDGKGENLYLVLNGNDEVIKMRWDDKKIIWQKPSGGIAPYGVTMANNKLYVTNWAGPIASDSTKERAGVPWGLVYTNPATGATAKGTVSVMDPQTGAIIKEINVGLHPNVAISSADEKYVYISNGNSDEVSVINTKNDVLAETVPVGMFQASFSKEGSTPNGLSLSRDNSVLYVSNGMDNAIAVVRLGRSSSADGKGQSKIEGYIPTEAYPAGTAIVSENLVVANLEGEGVNVVTKEKNARGVHYQLGSVSIIPLPNTEQLKNYTGMVYENALHNRMAGSKEPPRKNVAPVPVPERIGEPSVFKHVVYIIKENKTYDQVFGDMKAGRGDSTLCVFGERYTPNIHALARQYGWMDNYYASGKSSAEGHQWSNAAIVSDYVEKNVRTWLRSYPHRQTDAMVYNKSGYIWNQALDHGKTVRIYGEACTTIYDSKLKWLDLYRKWQAGEKPNWKNTSTIGRLLPIIAPEFPDNDNMVFNDQYRADAFIREWDMYTKGDSLPNLMILSLPNDHSAGTSPSFPTPYSMVADNDLALGRIIEHISNSKYFDSTVIMVTQDDSQGGWDHISGYRTVGLVVSAYSTGKLVTTNYNQTSMVRTIEQILGIPPMNVLDATATPMFDCFSSTKNATPFKKLANNVPLDDMNKPLNALRGRDKKFALKSMNEVYNEVDGGEDDEMNEIIWHYTRGKAKYPWR